MVSVEERNAAYEAVPPHHQSTWEETWPKRVLDFEWNSVSRQGLDGALRRTEWAL